MLTTNGQVERMNRTIKDATVKRFHYDDHDQLRRHLQDFIDAYNFGRRPMVRTNRPMRDFCCAKTCSTKARILERRPLARAVRSLIERPFGFLWWMSEK